MPKVETVMHLVRHGEVENPRSVRYGRLPGFHMSFKGRKQVEETTLFFIRRHVSHIYTSPLERTQQTATLIGLAFPHLSISLDDRLIEVKIAAQFQDKSQAPNYYYPLHPTTESETVKQTLRRMLHFLEEKVIQHQGEEVIAISHGDAIAITYSALTYGDTATLRGNYPTYGSVYSFVYRGLELQEIWYHDQLDQVILFDRQESALL